MPVGFKVDVKKCVGCNACAVACKAENKTRKGVSYRKVLKKEDGSSVKTYSVACNHCVDPACQAACPRRAISKDSTTGVVLIVQARCNGCRRCEWACPYGAPQHNSTTNKVEKCTFCEHNTARGPACAATCITGTLQAVSGAVTSGSYSKDISGVLPSSGLTNPNSYWRDDWTKAPDA